MAERDRFLSARVDPPKGSAAWLVLERTDGQWWLYPMNANRKILEAIPFASDDSAFLYSKSTYDIGHDDWTEDFTQ